MAAPLDLSAVARLLDRQPRFDPGVEASLEWPHAVDPVSFQQERHTGARGFVGSGAVEDDVSVARDLLLPLRELGGIEPARPREPTAFPRDLARMPQVEDHRCGVRAVEAMEIVG